MRSGKKTGTVSCILTDKTAIILEKQRIVDEESTPGARTKASRGRCEPDAKPCEEAPLGDAT